MVSQEMPYKQPISALSTFYLAKPRGKRGATEDMIRSIALAGLMVLATPAFAASTVTATWYGNELRGNRTANGEIFNPNGRTAAHRSLPFGTCLLVGNPKTGKSVKVRINDRGPFTKGVSLDLSAGAARAIGMRSTQKVTMSRC
jgi:rare lipoprotein A